MENEEEADETIPYAEEIDLEEPEETEIVKERWVKNISKRPLTKNEVSLLRKGGGFAVAPSQIPFVDYITAAEEAGRNLAKGEALTMKADIIEELEKAAPPTSNLTKAEREAITTLVKDDSIMILPADKGKCLVVMDREEYVNKMEEKLKDRTTYEPLAKDPTEEIKQAISKELKRIKDEGQLDNRLYYKMLPTKTKIPRMYGQPKIHKANYPLREIVDSTGSAAKEVDKYISTILREYVGKSEYYVKNSAHFADTIKDLRVEGDETLVSYDVEALYPSVPQLEAIDIFHQLMLADPNLANKTPLTANNIISLFKLIVKTTYFMFNRKLHKQIDGLAIGASSSGFAADLFMEKLEKKAISTFIEPPKLWRRYVDDTISKLLKIHVEAFLQHLNDQHPRINFTTETLEDGKIAFLDTQIHVKPDGETKITIYRKATHTDQYLDFGSNHHVKQKIGIINTFKHRISKLITEEPDKKKELKHVKKALKRCGHPNWALNRKQRPKEEKEKEERRGKVAIPYVKGLSERLGRVFRKYDIETIHKPTRTLKSILCCKMKDKVELLDRTGAVYYNQCQKHPDCDYVGETDRVLRERLYEHRIIDHKTAKRSASLHLDEEEQQEIPSGTRRSTRNRTQKIDYKAMQEGSNQILTEGNTEFSAHVASDVHERKQLRYSVLCSDDNWYRRGVKEAIAIRKIKPKLNQDDGRHHLTAMYDKLIHSSVAMKSSKPEAEDGSEDQNNF